MRSRYLIIAAITTVTAIITIGAHAAVGDPPPTPTNLEVISATEDSVTIAWGPTMPGDFYVVSEPKKNQLRVGWGASEDTRGPVTYTVTKDGTQVSTGQSINEYTVTGVGPKVKSFRVCVVPFVAPDKTGPGNCGTFTKT